MTGNWVEVPVENVGGNFYDKYHSRNPVARRLMAGFLAAFDELVGRTAANTAYEVGCGEGELSLRLLRRGLAVRGSDVAASIVAQPTVRHPRRVTANPSR